MKSSTILALGVAAVSVASASVSFAAVPNLPPVAAPSPLLGAGLPGLAILAVTGAGYVALRIRRRGRD